MRAPRLVLISAAGISSAISIVQSPGFNPQSPQRRELVSSATALNITTSLLLPGLNRNVTPGLAWVYPSSPNDLGARSMSCECFDPANQCCMPTSKLVAPFCMPNGSTCCGNTFCVEGESCCGDFCCAANTTCNLNIYTSGCCPTGSICQNLMTCYEASSPNCTNTITPAQQCCPSNMPYCRDFAPNGLGCYASSVPGRVSTMSMGMSAAPTSAISGTGKAKEGTTTSKLASIKTITVSVVSNKSRGLSLEFPPSTNGMNDTHESTTYLLEYPSSDIALSTTASLAAAMTSLHMVTGSDIYSTVYATTTSSAASSSSSSSTATTTSSTTATTSRSVLCFNTDLQTPFACPSSMPSTSNLLTAPTARSQANSMRALPTSAYALLVIIFILSGFVLLSALIYIIFLLLRWVSALKTPTPLRNYVDRSTQVQHNIAGMPIKPVPGSGRRLSSASTLGREITIFRDSARPYKEPVVIDKTRISVVEGSGHWIDGFDKKNPSLSTYTTYGTQTSTEPTALAISTNEKPDLGDGDLTFSMLASHGEKVLESSPVVHLKTRNPLCGKVFAKEKEKTMTRHTSQIHGSLQDMSQSVSTSTLSHVFLGARENA